MSRNTKENPQNTTKNREVMQYDWTNEAIIKLRNKGNVGKLKIGNL